MALYHLTDGVTYALCYMRDQFGGHGEGLMYGWVNEALVPL